MSIVTLNDRGVRSVSTFGSLNTGSMVFIKKLTASSSSTLSFVDGTSDVVLDDTYKEYLFTFKNIHPGTNNVKFQFNLSADTGSNYNVAKTTTYFKTQHNEGDTIAEVSYSVGRDLAQGTGVQILDENLGNDNDQNLSGYLRLFNPSSTTFVKHFTARISDHLQDDAAVDAYIAGYANTTSAVDAIQFSMNSGNIDAGDICLYGIL
jgi:hypothetical protein|tara:strand:+ start:1406 stop:2023 length:618 start_codon:yes stop_codon:yes gene_type:complete